MYPSKILLVIYWTKLKPCRHTPTCILTPPFRPLSIFRQENEEEDEEEKKQWKRPPSSYGSMKSESDVMEDDKESEEEVADAFPPPFPVQLPELTTHEATGYCVFV